MSEFSRCHPGRKHSKAFQTSSHLKKKKDAIIVKKLLMKIYRKEIQTSHEIQRENQDVFCNLGGYKRDPLWLQVTTAHILSPAVKYLFIMSKKKRNKKKKTQVKSKNLTWGSGIQCQL